MFNLFNCLTGDDYYSGKTITFNQLIDLIRQPNAVVDLARSFGKGSPEYDQIKKSNLPVIFANGYNSNNTRSTKSYFKSTGYIYLDFDFDSVEECEQYRLQLLISNYQFVSACWKSLSGIGLSILVRVNPDKCNKYQFLNYWDKLNEIFNGELDKRTRDYYRLLVIASDKNVYVNPNAVELDTIYQIEYSYGLNYRTVIPLSEFESLDKPVVVPDGLDVLQLDFFKYRIKKVSIGKRTSTIGAISMQLIVLNPDAPRKQLLNALLSFNRNYCIKPLTDKEVINILNANLNKSLPELIELTNKYRVKKYVFFHPSSKIPKPIKDKIRGEEMSKLKANLVNNTVDLLIQLNDKITVNQIAEYIGCSLPTVYKYLNNELRDKINNHNNGTFLNSYIYTLKGNNMRQIEKVPNSPTELQVRIYEALEDLQDGVNKITQQRVSEYTGISVRTIKRNWLESFKSLVSDYNKSLADNHQPLPEPAEQSINTNIRDILSPLPDDDQFDHYVIQIQSSKLYQSFYSNSLFLCKK